MSYQPVVSQKRLRLPLTAPLRSLLKIGVGRNEVMMNIKKLTAEQRDDFWGNGGPYSEVYFSIKTRILDNAVSRYKILIHVKINPLTFEICDQNKDKFKKDKLILDILRNSFDRDETDGYQYYMLSEDLVEDKQLINAKKLQRKLEKAILKMHIFAMDLLGIEKK